eukprot:182924_1
MMYLSMLQTPAQIAASGRRCGKFRHVYGENAKVVKHFRDIKPMTYGDSNYISANDKFMAISKQAGGSPVYILPLNNPKIVPTNEPMLSVSKSKTLDHDFHPFISNIIATVSEDCGVYVTLFPINGLTENITNADITMSGHTKKVSLCKFNPCANSILATASYDETIKIWNIELAQNIITFNGTAAIYPKDAQFTARIYSMRWNYDGSQLAITGKDKYLRIFDPRQLNVIHSTLAFDGRKNSNCFWISNIGWIGATGFSKKAERQIKFWDLKKLSEPIYEMKVDCSAS